MAKFILKDQRGNEQEFDHDKIFVMGTDGELVQFTQGEGDTPAVVQPLEVTENGTYTAPDGVDGFNQVVVNVDPTWKNILPKDEISGFALDSTFGAFSPGYVYPAAFALEVGKTYRVHWDGEDFERVAFAIPIDPNQTIIAVGNASSLNAGLPGDNETFLIIHNQTYNNTQLFSTETKESHDVGIWEKVAATSNDVRYVTFKSYDGLTEYGKKAVAVGDDCADPIARGIFTTPTRESDVQYNYTFYGWATTPGGGADANWNKAVTEDKTVYANFSKSYVYYTVTFYDDDNTTVLSTKNVTYGTDASYIPEKAGYKFKGWSEDVTNVTSNMEVYATWQVDDGYIHDDWATVVSSLEAGNTNGYKVGDLKELTLTYADGTIETIDVKLVGFNVAELESRNSGIPANGVFVAEHLLKDSRIISSTPLDNKASAFIGCELDAFVSDALYEALPSGLKEGVKNRAVNVGGSMTARKTWLLRNYDLIGSLVSPALSIGGTSGIMPNASDRIKYKKGSETAEPWWISDYKTQSSIVYQSCVKSDGTIQDAYSQLRMSYFNKEEGGVLFGFCV